MLQKNIENPFNTGFDVEPQHQIKWVKRHEEKKYLF